MNFILKGLRVTYTALTPYLSQSKTSRVFQPHVNYFRFSPQILTSRALLAPERRDCIALGLEGACQKGFSGTPVDLVLNGYRMSRLCHRNRFFIVTPETLKIRGVGGNLEQMVTNGEEIASAIRQWTQGEG